MTLDVTDASGAIVQWTVELDGLLNLTVFGWTPDTIRAGERVSVTGNPTHTGSPRVFFIGLERADGTRLLRPSFERFQAFERQRAERAAQRAADVKP